MNDPQAILGDRHATLIASLMAEVKDLERTKLAAEKKKERIARAYVHKEGSSIDFDAEMTRVSSEINATANAIAGTQPTARRSD